MGKTVYWERYHGDTRPMKDAQWVWDDGTNDSYQYVLNYGDMLLGGMDNSWWTRSFDTEDRADWIAHGTKNAIRYYTTRFEATHTPPPVRRQSDGDARETWRDGVGGME